MPRESPALEVGGLRIAVMSTLYMTEGLDDRTRKIGPENQTFGFQIEICSDPFSRQLLVTYWVKFG